MNAGNSDVVESRLKEMNADYLVFESDIDNLVKEMTEENENDRA